ncbi:hypothetical protein SAMN04489760_1159 [Syntrophus gentianae]|uniref:Acetyltransferase (GNAT) domain-containing protein n=1 Tax=Syntrophus gentianae TaxID=43775 RepID=A0A1H7Y947_9BACT|nr:hypothetical protein [Syntrophus gentianae]SEM42692.1 hypothetical protein SAMN04489760_1159 [Syntrophus gentianae]
MQSLECLDIQKINSKNINEIGEINDSSLPMAEFFERLGHKIISSPLAMWYDVQPHVLLSFPYYKLIEPTEEELESLVRIHKLRAIRYPTMLNKFGYISNIAINTSPDYDLSHLRSKARNLTRRGLENNKVEQVDFEYLIDKGLPLNEDTARRQGRESQYTDPNYWRKYCLAAKATNGVSAFGAFVQGQLSAFLVAIECGDWVEWVVNHSSTGLQNKRSNNALVFCAAQHFFQEKKRKGICYGLGSLEQSDSLDHYKSTMGWQLEPVKQRLIFSRNLHYIFSNINEPCLKILGKLFPKSYTIRKTSAMIRLYRQQSFNSP